MSSDHLPFKPGDRVNGYVRDSGGDTQDLSVQQQVKEIERFCREHELELVHVFKDIAKSGTSTIRRTAFAQMIDHFRSRECSEKGLIIWNYSRFARNLADFQFYIYDLQRRDFRIHSLMDAVPEGIEGQLVRFVLAWSAQQFSEKLSQDAKRGLTHMVTEYGGVPGVPPPGFKRVRVEIGRRRDGRPRVVHRWEVDDDEVDAVILAWHLRASGAGYQEIHEKTHLYHSRNGYTTFFRNKIYIGILEFGEVTIEGYCDPVISAEVWETVQRLNRSAEQAYGDSDHPDHPNRKRGGYLLTGLARCGLCGSAVNGSTVSRDGGQVHYAYYWCSRAKSRRDCEAIRIPKEALEAEILRRVADFILNPDFLEELYVDDGEARVELRQSADERRADLARKQAVVGGKITRVLGAIEQAEDSQALVDRLAVLEQRRDQLVEERRRLELDLERAGTELTRADLERIAGEMRAGLADRLLDVRREAIRGVVDEIRLTRLEGKRRRIRVEIEYMAALPKVLGPGQSNASGPYVPGHRGGGGTPGDIKTRRFSFSFSARKPGGSPKKTP